MREITGKPSLTECLLLENVQRQRQRLDMYKERLIQNRGNIKQYSYSVRKVHLLSRHACVSM